MVTSPIPCPDAACTWEYAGFSDEENERRLAAHQQLRHGIGPVEPLTKLEKSAWEALADDAIRQAAARSVTTGVPFLMWEALRDAGVPDHPTPDKGMGLYAQRVHRRGLAHPCAFDLSERSSQSAVRKWTGDVAKCTDAACARKAVLL